MRTGRFPAAKLVATLFLIVALISGCGGGDQSSGSQDGGDKASGEQGDKKEDDKKPDDKKDGDQAERKIALGTIVAVNAEADKFSLKPSDPEAEDKSMKFKAGKGAKIMADGEKAEFSDIKKGQQLKVEYIVKDDKNRSRLVQLLGGSGEKTGGETKGDETTG